METIADNREAFLVDNLINRLPSHIKKLAIVFGGSHNLKDDLEAAGHTHHELNFTGGLFKDLEYPKTRKLSLRDADLFCTKKTKPDR